MTPLTKLLIVLAINIAIALYVIISTRRSNLPESTRLPLYILAVLMPIVGLILFFIVNRKKV
jgi:hypothetical protein